MDVAARIRELKSKRRKELDQIANRTPGVKTHKNLTKLDVAKRIANAELEKELENPTPATETTTETTESGGPSPEFAALAGGTPPPPETTPDNEERRGGFRPGAGRKVGQTVEVCKWSGLPVVPDPDIRELLEMAFNAWAMSVGDEGIALTKEEAFKLALPYTRVAKANGWLDKKPSGIMEYGKLVWTTANIAMIKARMAHKAKPESFLKIRLMWSALLHRLGIGKKSKEVQSHVTSNHTPDIRETGQRENGQVSQPDSQL